MMIGRKRFGAGLIDRLARSTQATLCVERIVKQQYGGVRFGANIPRSQPCDKRDNGAHFGGGPKVRSHLPPAASSRASLKTTSTLLDQRRDQATAERRYMRLNVRLPPAKRDEILPLLDRWAKLIPQLTP